MTVVTLVAASGFHGEDAALIVVIAVLRPKDAKE